MSLTPKGSALIRCDEILKRVESMIKSHKVGQGNSKWFRAEFTRDDQENLRRIRSEILALVRTIENIT